METEQIWIARARTGDDKALQMLVETYQNYVFAIIFPIVRNQQDTENLAQETFFKMFRSLATFQGQSFKSWLGKIAVHLAIDWNRKQQRYLKRQQSYWQEQVLEGKEAGPEEQLLDNEDRKQLKALLGKLPDKYSRVLNQYYVEEKTYQQIAQAEGISVRTVESRLYRGKKLLNQAWRGDGSWDI